LDFLADARPGREGWCIVPVHAFVDESQRARVYMVAVAIVEPVAVAQLRKDVRALLLPGQRELHFKKEKPDRRRQLADAVARWPVEVTVYTCTYRRHPEPARQACLQRLLADLLDRQAGRLVIDSREEQDRDDERTIRQVLRGHPSARRLTWEHTESTGELLLALPDLAAWCYGAGGDWRKRIEPILADVLIIDV
jgi:hypothetical protein